MTERVSAKDATPAQADGYVRKLGRTLFSGREANLHQRLVRAATGTFGLNVAYAGLSFASAVLLARLMGARGYGIYVYVLALANILIIPSLLGLDRLLIREVATYHTQAEWSLMRGLLRRATQGVLLISLSLAVAAAISAWLWVGHIYSETLRTFWLALLLVPLLALTRIRQATMRGLHHVIVSQLPESLIQPVLFILLIGSIHLLWSAEVTPPWATGLRVVTTGVAFLAGTLLLQKRLPLSVRAAAPAFRTRTWLRSSFPMLALGGLTVVNAQTDTLMLWALSGARAAGIYSVANRGAVLVAFALTAVHTAFAPTIAKLWAEDERASLQRIVTKSARVVLLISFPVALGLIVFGYWFLLIFGPEFVQGRAALAVLTASQLFSVAIGSVGLLLVMTGHERDAALGLGASALLNVLLNLILIPLWGINGAAVATSSSMIFWSILMARRVYQVVGIQPAAWGRLGG